MGFKPFIMKVYKHTCDGKQTSSSSSSSSTTSIKSIHETRSMTFFTPSEVYDLFHNRQQKGTIKEAWAHSKIPILKKKKKEKNESNEKEQENNEKEQEKKTEKGYNEPETYLVHQHQAHAEPKEAIHLKSKQTAKKSKNSKKEKD